MVAFLGPGVGAEQVEARDRCGGQEPFHGVGAFHAEYLCVCESYAVTGFADFADASQQAFYGKKASFGVVFRDFAKEFPVTTAKIYFKKGIFSENFFGSESFEEVFRDKGTAHKPCFYPNEGGLKSLTRKEVNFFLERIEEARHFHVEMKTGAFLFFISLCLILVSCGGGYEGYKNKPYKVGGVRYQPMAVEQALGHREEGLASWYDESSWIGLVGNGTTALGETVYPWTECAAHKTLPLPARIKVTNLENGKSTKVRVNDRGPFLKNRILDVSSSVADDLDMKKKGIVRVRVEVLSVGDGKWERKS